MSSAQAGELTKSNPQSPQAEYRMSPYFRGALCLKGNALYSAARQAVKAIHRTVLYVNSDFRELLDRLAVPTAAVLLIDDSGENA